MTKRIRVKETRHAKEAGLEILELRLTGKVWVDGKKYDTIHIQMDWSAGHLIISATQYRAKNGARVGVILEREGESDIMEFVESHLDKVRKYGCVIGERNPVVVAAAWVVHVFELTV